MPKPKHVGKVLESRTCGTFEVVEFVGDGYYKIRFLQTGYVTNSKSPQITSGLIRDPYYPRVYGVGCVGETPVRIDGKLKPLRSTWGQMLRRCYDDTFWKWGSYGGRGIKVCERWLCFENYENDVMAMDGYGVEGLSIDRTDNDGDYCPENCRFANHRTQRTNQRKPSTSNSRWFKGTSPEGVVFVSNNQTSFAREHALHRGGISACLTGKISSHKSWVFERIENNGGASDA